jgi:DNA-binding MarR family transcriptional regulator
MPQYDDCIIFLLAKAYQKAHSLFKNRLQVHGLTPVQHLILEVLWEEEGLSAGDIAKRLLLDNATLSGVLDRMAESGWIRKEPDSVDKRFLRIFLREKTMAQKEALQREREIVNGEMMSCLRLEEKALVKRMLRDMQR